MESGKDTIVKIESAKPVISKNPNLPHSFYVKNWKVTGFTWDGSCMCTKKPFKMDVGFHWLDVSEKELVRLVKEKLND